MDHMQCAAKHMEEAHRQMDVAILNLEFIRDHVPYKDQLQAVCCFHFQFRQRIIRKALKWCDTSSNLVSTAATGDEDDLRDSGHRRRPSLRSEAANRTAAYMDRIISDMAGKSIRLDPLD